MTTTPRLDLNKLVAQIVLDTALLKWFADNGRRVAALSAIAATRDAKGEHAVLDFLERHCGGGPAMNSPTTLEAAVAEIARLTRENAEQLEVIAHLQGDVIELKAENERLQDAKRPGEANGAQP